MIDKSSNQGSDLDKILLACKNTVKADMDKKSLSCEWNSPDESKAVKIELDGLSKEVINWASLNEGDLIFNIDLSGRKRMYVISDVVYARGEYSSLLDHSGDLMKIGWRGDFGSIWRGDFGRVFFWTF